MKEATWKFTLKNEAGIWYFMVPDIAGDKPVASDERRDAVIKLGKKWIAEQKRK